MVVVCDKVVDRAKAYVNKVFIRGQWVQWNLERSGALRPFPEIEGTAATWASGQLAPGPQHPREYAKLVLIQSHSFTVLIHLWTTKAILLALDADELHKDEA